MLTSRIELIQGSAETLDAEDILASASDQLFPDSTRVFHGDASTRVRYNSAAYGPLELSVTDPADEHERSKFAHALWNASVLLCEMIGSGGGTAAGSLLDENKRKEEKEAYFGRKESLNAGTMFEGLDSETWNMNGESVLELGAGTDVFQLALICIKRERAT